MSHAISKDLLQSFADTIHTDSSHKAAQRAVTLNNIYPVAGNNTLSATNTTIFSDELETGSVTDQKSSGRCWLFAHLNVIRHQIAKDNNLDDIELSQSYSFFWDKLEKSNTFYERIIASADAPLDDRWVQYILDAPQFDGGWWEYAASLIEKYGVVPKSAMPESEATSDSHQLNTLLNHKLRKDALALRDLVSKHTPATKVQSTKEAMLQEVYRILTIAIGTPPAQFDFVFKDKDKKYHRQDAITPTEFLKKYYKQSVTEYVSLLNDPSESKSYNQAYTFEHDGNVIDGVNPLFLNVDMQTLKDLTQAQIKAGESVWFGCDVGADSSKKGFMSLDTFDFDSTFGVDFSLSKADRLASRDSSVTHAMTITGVDIVAGEAKQWKVENSWGEKRGKNGYYTMSSDWFDKNGYVVVIRQDLLPEALKEALKKPAITIPSWDPLNSLPG